MRATECQTSTTPVKPRAMRAGRCSGFPGSSCRLNDPGLSRRPARVSYHGPVFLKLVRRENRQTRRQPSPGSPSHLFHLRQKPWNFASPSDTLSDRHKIIEALPAVFRELFVGRAAPHTEPLALRQRGAVLKRIRSRPALRMSDGINRRDSRSRSTVRQAAGRQAPRGFFAFSVFFEAIGLAFAACSALPESVPVG